MNPFVIKSYTSKELFCDREKELELLMRYCDNDTDLTLISQRRMGKTGLIFRLFDEMKALQSDIVPIYIDIFASRSLADFIKIATESSLKAFPEKTSIGRKLTDFIKSLRPQISFDPISGEPQIQLSYQTEHEKEYTLRGLLDFLDSQQKRILIAIDEFQQIREYPEKNIEALLRTYMQQMKNLHFIFCGSKKHMMTDIFTNAKKPFYSSTMFITLDKIPTDSYSSFIKRLMHENGREISDEAVDFILTWTKRHTYYTQQLCHTIYANEATSIELSDVKAACEQLMQQFEPVFMQYRQMLTDNQWNYLIALSKEGELMQTTSKTFLKKYNISTPSVSKRLLESLREKELISDNTSLKGTTYSVSDVFMSHWMERL